MQCYIQSAYAMIDEDKKEAELLPLKKVQDSFKKIIIRNDIPKHFYDDNGFLNINIIDFLLNDEMN